MTACILCHHDLTATERQTCARCLADVRRSLARLERLFAMLPSMLSDMSGSGITAIMGRGEDHYRLPAEDVLTMLGPGSSSHVGLESDPPVVAFELGTWAQDWAEIRSEDPPRSGVPAVVDWLSTRAGWAADHHPAFDEFASDLRRIVLRLEDVTGTSNRPERGAPCIYCRTVNLEREFTDQGRVDDWTCPRCRRAFPEAHYRLAIRMALEDEAERMQA